MMTSIWNTANRREWLLSAGQGLGAVAFAAMSQRDRLAADEVMSSEHLSVRTGHHAATARSVIFLFMDGGPSHLDTFDHKPRVNEFAGKPLPESVERVLTPMGVSNNPLLASKREWKKYGDSGLEV